MAAENPQLSIEPVTDTPGDGERVERALKTMYFKLEKRIVASSLASLTITDWVKITFRFLLAQLIVALVLMVIAWLPVALLFGVLSATR